MADGGDSTAQDWMECGACQRWLDRPMRGRWNCGLLPAAERVGEAPAPWVGKKHGGPQPTVCAGYTTSLPLVAITSRAMHWADSGMLKDFLQADDLPRTTFDYIDILRCAVQSAERYAISEERT